MLKQIECAEKIKKKSDMIIQENQWNQQFEGKKSRDDLT